MTDTMNGAMRAKPGNARGSHALRLLVAAPLAALLAWAPSLAGAAPGSMDDRWEDVCQCFRNVPYGPVSWFDPTYKPRGMNLTQDFDLWPVQRGATKQPVIIWAHPYGQTKSIPITRPGGEPGVYQQVIKPALDAGFAVISLEFRHPVHNDYIVPAPHVDVVTAIQNIRANADRLGIDPKNIFLSGSSMGTLVAWTGVQDEMRKPKSRVTVERQSSRVNAIWVYNAQTTYQGQQTADLFIVPEERVAFVADFQAEHPQYALFGSAISSTTPNDPPIRLNYEHAFRREFIPTSEMDMHHPDFGLALCDAYARAGIGSRCSTFDLVPKEGAYVGFTDFFTQHLR